MFSDTVMMDSELLKLLPAEIWLMIKRISVKKLLEEKLKFPQAFGLRLNNELLSDLYVARVGAHKWMICTTSNELNTAITHYWKDKPQYVDAAYRTFQYDWAGLELVGW
jgi:hypothetical protein